MRTVEDQTPVSQVQDFIVGAVASILRKSKNEFSVTQPLFELGMSSIDILELNKRIKDWLGVLLEPAFFFEHNTCERIIVHLQQERDRSVMNSSEGTASRSVETQDEKASNHPARRKSIEGPQDVAIVGAACILPGGIGDPQMLWKLLEEGREAVGTLPLGRWQWPDNIDPQRTHQGIDRGAFLDDISSFDSHFFRISPKEAAFMDPQQRLLLQLAWNCLEDACCSAAALAGSRTGVFVGASGTDYRIRLTERMMMKIDGHFHQGSSMAILPNRISYCFDWSGPSIQIDTACSSSLVALHEAVKSLHLNECAQALVAGINIMCHPSRTISFYEAGMLAHDGKCKTFDKNANGYVRGEGAVAILIKHLDDAVKDGNHIYGVIKGTAINHGGQSAGLTVPHPARQADLIRQALQTAGVEANSISYIETHGTGTSLGDPIEIRGLQQAFGCPENTDSKGQRSFCGLGSIKTNLGHLEAAAGLAGLLKVLLCMQHKQLPPSLNFHELNPHISLEASPFYIVDRSRFWSLAAGQKVRRAGVSSFGAGGVNAHVVIEEYVLPISRPRALHVPCTQPAVIVLSARTSDRLRERAKQLMSAVSTSQLTDEDLTSIAYTLQVGRVPMECRLGMQVTSLEEMQEKLNQFLAGAESVENLQRGEVKQNKEALVPFKDDEEIREAVKKWMERGKLAKVLEVWVKGFPIDWSYLYAEAKPSLLNLPPYPFAGERYWVDDEAESGNVTSNKGKGKILHPLLQENTSDLKVQRFSTWLSGTEFFVADHAVEGRKILAGVAYLEMARAAVERSANCEKNEKAWMELSEVVWLKPVVVEEKGVCLKIELYEEPEGKILYEIYSEEEREGRVLHGQGRAVLLEPGNAPVLDFEELQRQCGTEVMNEERCYQEFAQAGLSYGPGHRNVKELHLGRDKKGNRFGLGKLELPSAVADTAAQYVLHPGVLDGALQASLGLRMRKMDGEEGRNPGLPFAVEKVRIYGQSGIKNWVWVREAEGSSEEVRKLDIDVSDEEGWVWIQLEGFSARQKQGHEQVTDGLEKKWEDKKKEANEKGTTGTILLERIWEDQPAPSLKDEQTGQERAMERIVLLCEMEEEAQEAVEKNLGVTGTICVRLRKAGEGIAERYEGYAKQLLNEVQNKLREGNSQPVLLQLIVGTESAARLCMGLWGLLKTAQLENPRLIPQVIAVEAGDVEMLCSGIQENQKTGEAGMIRYRQGKREVATWNEIEHTAKKERQRFAFRDSGVYLITGGAGGLGLLFAEEVARQAKGAQIVLVGRSAASEPVKMKIKEIQQLGADAEYWQVDVSDRNAVEEMVKQIRSKWGGVNGVVHSAGVICDSFLMKKTDQEMDAVLRPKVHGLVNVDEALAGDNLDFLLMFSSGTGSWGNVGQGDYAAANGFMDSYAWYRQELVEKGERHGQTISIGWPLWLDGGMQRNEKVIAQRRETMGLAPLETGKGIEAFYNVLTLGTAQVAVIHGDQMKLRTTFLRMDTPVLNRSDGEEKAEEPITNANPEPSGDVATQAIHYFKKLLASVLKVSPEFIEVDELFTDYGLDSIMVMQVIHELEKSFGVLRKTLLFEYTTVASLAQHFLETYGAKLRIILGIVEQSNSVRELKPKPAQVPSQTATSRLRRSSRVEKPTISKRIQREDRSASRLLEQDIAIIGLSGRYPQARNLAEFWNNLQAGKDCISEIPVQRWNPNHYFDPEKGKLGKSYSKWGGFIDGVEEFDPLFFHISPREAELMDPQERLFLQCAYETLEDAGYTRETLRRYHEHGIESNVGVFVGVLYLEYQLYGAQAQVTGQPIALNGNAGSIANRVSHFCDFHGPSMAVDTMCSSSLTAIHLACQSLHRGECEVALAGGVNVAIHPNKYLRLSQGQYVSSQGRCESFGEGGDGYVPGEGIGAALLKPLKKAVADRDRIYGIIKGSAINHGGRTNGYTVPNPVAQANVIAQALQQSGLPTHSISYIEAHGTGTKLGDPVEIAGLSKVYLRAIKDQPSCAIGSVKSNIGHGESAAGIAALTKVLLQMKHQQLVPSLHTEHLNPHIDFDDTVFIVQRELQEWKRPRMTIDGQMQEFPRIAGISSFGAGGANCHLIVQEYVDAQQFTTGTGREREDVALIVLSARREDQLKAQAKNLLLAMEELTDADLDGLAYTLQVGREAMEYRLAAYVTSLTELRQKLERFLAGDEDIAHLYLGYTGDTKSAAEIFTEDEDLQKAVESWIQKRKYAKLLNLWVKGLKFAWERLYADRRPKRIGLPTYPFARERYWIPNVDRKSASTAALSDNAVPCVPKRESRPAAKPSGIQLEPVEHITASLPAPDHTASDSSLMSLQPPEQVDGTAQPKRTSIALRQLGQELTVSLADALYMEPTDINPNKAFVELGLDSIVGVEWIRVINRQYGTSLPVTRLYDYSTIRDLARFLNGELLKQAGTGNNAPPVSNLLKDVFEGAVTADEAGELLQDLLNSQ